MAWWAVTATPRFGVFKWGMRKLVLLTIRYDKANNNKLIGHIPPITVSLCWNLIDHLVENNEYHFVIEHTQNHSANRTPSASIPQHPFWWSSVGSKRAPSLLSLTEFLNYLRIRSNVWAIQGWKIEINVKAMQNNPISSAQTINKLSLQLRKYESNQI